MSHNNLKLFENETFLYICGLIKKNIKMKKTILFFTLCVSVAITNAQTAVVVDEHAGHNHAKEATKAPTKPVETKAAVAVDEHAGHNHAKQAPVEVNPASMTAVSEVTKPIAEDVLAVKEMEFDFGKIPQGKPVTHVFTVANSGKTPFKLENVQASCGCTTPVWDKEKVIAPGTTAEITVGYNAAAEGPFTKPVTITYNGTQSKVITIKGTVWKTPTESAPTNGAINDLKN
jgi:Protein of unknown function (DUF1573)